MKDSMIVKMLTMLKMIQMLKPTKKNQVHPSQLKPLSKKKLKERNLKINHMIWLLMLMTAKKSKVKRKTMKLTWTMSVEHSRMRPRQLVSHNNNNNNKIMPVLELTGSRTKKMMQMTIKMYLAHTTRLNMPICKWRQKSRNFLNTFKDINLKRLT